MKDELELKPCPFCGYDQDDFAGMYEESFSKCSDGSFAVCCSECDCVGARGSSLEEAVKAWNTRVKLSVKELRFKDEAGADCFIKIQE